MPDIEDTESGQPRSEEARALHDLIVSYCVGQKTPEDAARYRDRIREKLEAVLTSNPKALLEKSIRGYTHINDLLHLAFASDVKRDKALSIKIASEGFDVLVAAYRKAVDTGVISKEEFAAVLTTAASDGFTPLHSAIMSGDADLYKKMAKELASLRSVMGDKIYAQQFTLPSSGNYTLLQDVVSSGNLDLLNAVLSDMESVLDRTQMQDQLRHHSNNRRNLFHCATNIDEARETPNPFVIDRLIKAFSDHFSEKDAQRNISKQIKKSDKDGNTPNHSGRPEWLQALLTHNTLSPYTPKFPDSPER